jgi:predicted dehydrogenase
VGTEERITINSIGAGRWGPNIVRALMNLPGVTVGRVADTDEQRLRLIGEHIGGIETTTDVQAAIRDERAAAIVIATPVHTHYELTRAALEAGKHVLVEKPFCRRLDECAALSELAESRGLVLAVGHVFLFNAGIRKVRRLISEGALGRVVHLHAIRTNLGPIRSDVSALWDLAAHDLSIFDYLLDGGPVSVSAVGQRALGGELEDLAVANFTYPDGVVACAYVSWLHPRKVREITVVGDRRMAAWNDMDLIEPVRLYEKSVEREPAEAYADSFCSFHATIREGDVIIPKVTAVEPLREECAHFVSCVREGTRPLNDSVSATRVVRSLCAAEESLRSGGRRVLLPACDARHTEQLTTHHALRDAWTRVLVPADPPGPVRGGTPAPAHPAAARSTP